MRKRYNYIISPKIYNYEQIECELGRSRAGVSQVLACVTYFWEFQLSVGRNL